MLALERWETTPSLTKFSIVVGAFLMLLGLLAVGRQAFVLRRHSEGPSASRQRRVAWIFAIGAIAVLSALAWSAVNGVWEDLFQTALQPPLTTKNAPEVALYDVDRDGSADMMALSPQQDITGPDAASQKPALVPVPRDAGGNGVLIAVAIISALGATGAAAMSLLQPAAPGDATRTRGGKVEDTTKPTEDVPEGDDITRPAVDEPQTSAGQEGPKPSDDQPTP